MKEKSPQRPPRLQERDDVLVEQNRCPYCHEDVEATESVVCQQCLTRHHDACWEEGGACSSCGSDAMLAPRAPKGWNLQLPPDTRIRIVEQTETHLELEWDYATAPGWWATLLAGIILLPVFLVGLFPLLVALRFRTLKARVRVDPDRFRVLSPYLIRFFGGGALDFPWLDHTVLRRGKVGGVRIHATSIGHSLDVDQDGEIRCLIAGANYDWLGTLSRSDLEAIRRLIETWRDR